MFRNCIFPFLVFLSMYTLFDCQEDTNQPNWLKGLTKHIQQDTSSHQVLLIINEDLFRNEERVEKMLREIKRFRPSIQFLVRIETIQPDIQGWKKLEIFGLPRTVFLIIIDSVRNDLNIAQKVIKTFTILLKGRSRPKCLLLQFADVHKSLDPTKKLLLQTAWKNQFLDISILEISGNASKVQYLNPFTHIYSTKKYTSRTELFPDKLRNMSRYQLEVGVMHLPPHVYIEYNSSGYPVSYFGSDIRLLNALATKMNFIPKYMSDGKIENKLMLHLIQNKLQISLLRQTLNFGENSFLEVLITGFGSMNALIPIQHEKQKEFNTLYFLQILFPIAVFSALLLLLIYVLKRYSNVWSFPFTLQVVLGMTVPQEPGNWKTRIIFAYVIIVSFLYSSKIYAMLTSINMESIPDLEVRTLVELDKSGLKLELSPIFIEAMSRKIQNLDLVKRYQNVFSNTEECVRHVIAEKNVDCLMLKSHANWFHMHFKDEDGSTLTQIVQESFITSAEGFYLNPGSPYVERLNSFLLRLMAFGIFGKWNKDRDPQSPSIERNKEVVDDMQISSNVLLSILVTELLVGFMISGIVFVIEIVLAKIKKTG